LPFDLLLNISRSDDSLFLFLFLVSDFGNTGLTLSSAEELRPRVSSSGVRNSGSPRTFQVS
jgi:hypothetical protein